MSSNFFEKILLYKLKTGKDPEAYGKLYDNYVEKIYRFVYFKVSSHEEAEDITSEVFLKAWDYFKEEREVRNFGALLYRIARNLIVDHYRQRAAKPEVIAIVEETEVGDGRNYENKLHDKVAAEELLVALKKLKQEYQEVVTLRYVDGLEIDEIAGIVGKGKVAVRVTLHRALKKLEEIAKK